MCTNVILGEEFGPAQNMHGATYTVDVDILTESIVEKSNWVVDIGEFSSMLSDVLSSFNFKNLNELFPTENTTTEFMCRTIHSCLSNKLRSKEFKGKLRVKLFESHKAWASYTNTVSSFDSL